MVAGVGDARLPEVLHIADRPRMYGAVVHGVHGLYRPVDLGKIRFYGMHMFLLNPLKDINHNQRRHAEQHP